MQKQKQHYFRRLFPLFLFIVILLIFTNFLLFLQIDTNRKSFKHQLCILFPFKNRWEIAQITIPKLSNFLKFQQISTPKFIIINQTDNFRFNRAMLLNIGALQAKKLDCDYIALHDIDIVPLNPELNYTYPGEGQLFHITSGEYHPIKRYNYKTYIGGVLLITINDFFKINGMSNNFWGWGLEDDEFYQRLRDAGLSNNINRPKNLNTTRINTFLHLHDNNKNKRDYFKDDYKRKVFIF